MQLTNLIIEFPCDNGCSSKLDDDTIMNLVQAMPKLETLQLGDSPCDEIPTGITIKGLVALANHCLDLNQLCIHFQVASLSTPPTSFGITSDAGSTVLRRDCALRTLEVGEIPVLEESALVVALMLLRIFPCLNNIEYIDDDWEKVVDAIHLTREIVDCSGKAYPPPHPKVTLMAPPQEPHPVRMAANQKAANTATT